MTRWVLATVIMGAAALVFLTCSPPGSDGDADADADEAADGDSGCLAGAWRCTGVAYEMCVDGGWRAEECEGLCVEGHGCVACDPGGRYCEGNTLMQCREDGSGADLVQECDTAAGYLCSGGSCTNACGRAMEDRSNLGCEYWAVDLDNAWNRGSGLFPGDRAAGGQFAVVVANPDPNLSAHVVAEVNNAAYQDPLDLEVVGEAEVRPHELFVFELPRRDADGEGSAPGVDDGPQTWISSRAFRITSTSPVVAYQFNPIDQRYSNDASLLLPTSGLDAHHIVLGYPPTNAVAIAGVPPSRAYVAVVGVEEDTLVEITPTSRTLAGPNVPQLQAGETFEATLGPFDLLNLETDLVTLQEANRGIWPDLTGTIVTSSRPVAVFFGTDLSSVAPIGYEGPAEGESAPCCAEHLEAQILPTSAMGTRFVVTRSPVRSTGVPEVDVYRVLAVADGTTVTTSLAGEAASFSLDAGEFFAFNADRPFILQSNEDHPVHVGQFLVSQGHLDGPFIGDPTFVMFPAVEEWRGLYLFTTGRGFTNDYVSIAMPDGVPVTLDDVDVLAGLCDPPVAIGELDGVSYVQVVCEIEDGTHEVDSGEAPAGVTVYGYYRAGSYGYSAGSELTRIYLI